MVGNFGAAYQDFENDVAIGLEQGLMKLKSIGKLNVITLPTSLYGSLIQRKISEFCQENGIEVEFMSCAPEKVRKGDAFLVLTSQLDPGLISLVDNAKGMSVGTDYYIISYNDSPIDRVVLNGLTTISTDFNEMGREIARMVNAKTLWKLSPAQKTNFQQQRIFHRRARAERFLLPERHTSRAISLLMKTVANRSHFSYGMQLII